MRNKELIEILKDELEKFKQPVNIEKYMEEVYDQYSNKKEYKCKSPSCNFVGSSPKSHLLMKHNIRTFKFQNCCEKNILKMINVVAKSDIFEKIIIKKIHFEQNKELIRLLNLQRTITKQLLELSKRQEKLMGEYEKTR